MAGYLERQREHSHEQANAKHFLIGLKKDLAQDLQGHQEDGEGYLTFGKAYNYLLASKTMDRSNKDSIKIHYGALFGTRKLLANGGRYEEFKSSGQLSHIEYEQLQDAIVQLYEVDIPVLLIWADGYENFKKKWFDYFLDYHTYDKDDKNSNMNELLYSDKAMNLAVVLARNEEVIHGYDTLIVHSKEIIKLVEQEYPEEH